MAELSSLGGSEAEAYERIRAQRPDPPVVVTCEHASERLPSPWTLPEEDTWLRGTHWMSDIGAASLARRLAERLGADAVLAGFSRILVDPNRDEDDETLIRTHADGRRIALNQGVSPEERERRLGWWSAYHDAVAATVSASTAPILFAVHSFTPSYEGQARAMTLGVLYDHEEVLARRLADHLQQADLEPNDVRLNEPYSGKDGLIYCVHRHAVACDRRALEIEVRQDLLVTPDYRDALLQALVSFFDVSFFDQG